MRIDGYIPKDIYDEAKYFLSEIDGDCLMYRISRDGGSLEPSHEADAFHAFWQLGRYAERPEALRLLLENKDYIDRQIYDSYGDSIAQFACEVVTLKLAAYYTLLHEEGIIGE